MGTDDIFKKNKEKNQKRKEASKNKRKDKILIFSEGEKTETNYFKAIVKHLENTGRLRNGITIEVEGFGEATTKLVKTVKTVINNTAYDIDPQNVWIVFDKDSFLDFNEAIQMAEDEGYSLAWSNECFELWYLLHFNYLDSAIDRNVYYKKIEDLFNEHFYCSYEKNSEKIFELLSQDETYLKNAIKYTNSIRNKAFMKDILDKRKFDLAKPCTFVDELVILLFSLVEEDLTLYR